MLMPGLTSITFRQLNRAEVVAVAARAGLEGLEWGGDVHVPPGDAAAAGEAAHLCREAGIVIPSYGSYFRLGIGTFDEWRKVRDSALALNASIVRVWAGRTSSELADENLRAHVARAGRGVAESAAEVGLRVACEWHGGTLTDRASSATALFDAVAHPAFGTYWQPPVGMGVEDCLVDQRAALPRLMGLHVFQWHPQTRARQPLALGESCWTRYLLAAGKAIGNRTLFAHLEFTRDDDPDNLVADAAVLISWLNACNAQTGEGCGHGEEP